MPGYRRGQGSSCISRHCGTNRVNEADYHRSYYSPVADYRRSYYLLVSEYHNVNSAHGARVHLDIYA